MRWGAATLNAGVLDAAPGEVAAYGGVVVAAVEVQGLDIVEQPGVGDCLKGGV